MPGSVEHHGARRVVGAIGRRCPNRIVGRSSNGALAVLPDGELGDEDERHEHDADRQDPREDDGATLIVEIGTWRHDVSR